MFSLRINRQPSSAPAKGKGARPPNTRCWVERSSIKARQDFVAGDSSLTSPLHVVLHKLLSVLFQDVVDLVEELVDVFLDLRALLGELRTAATAFAPLGGFAGPRFLFLLLLRPMTLRADRIQLDPRDWKSVV